MLRSCNCMPFAATSAKPPLFLEARCLIGKRTLRNYFEPSRHKDKILKPCRAESSIPRNAGIASTGSSGTTTSNSSSPSTSASSQPEDAKDTSTADPSTLLRTFDASTLRKALSTRVAHDALEVLSEHKKHDLSEQDMQQLIQAALERGNVQLALSLHDGMCHARAAGSSLATSSFSDDQAADLPPASIQTTICLILGLCRQLAISDALHIIACIKGQGLPSNEAVSFGKTIPSPLAPSQTLTVVAPQEGCKLVADAFSKYEYEVFSGEVVNTKSEALQTPDGILYSLLRFSGIWRKPPAAAIHEFVVQAPDGVSRTFRVATPSADVPAQVGERVTFVSAPGPTVDRSRQPRRPQGLLSPTPPGAKPGEALASVNHRTGVVTPLLRPPLSSSQDIIPSWLLPLAVVVTGGDAASSLIDPALPGIVAVGATALLGSAVATNQVLLPRLKQLPDKTLELEYARQKLLGEYAQLSQKVQTVVAETGDDVRALARLWQLQNKMQSVGGAASSAYRARIERVMVARVNLEQRLSKKLELMDGYCRVMSMIEIEVEMDMDVPAAELEGIVEQLQRLDDLEALQDDWKVQAEARDEVERLLRSD